MSENLGQLESLVHEDVGFAADVTVAEFVRGTSQMLKAMRKRTGLDQTQFGERIGLSQGRISQIESGLMDHAPNLETIALYANACAERVALRASGEEAFGETEAEEAIFSIFARHGFARHGEDVYGYAETPIELVARPPAIRAAILKRTGITQVKGSSNRFRLSEPLSASIMTTLGLKKEV